MIDIHRYTRYIHMYITYVCWHKYCTTKLHRGPIIQTWKGLYSAAPMEPTTATSLCSLKWRSLFLLSNHTTRVSAKGRTVGIADALEIPEITWYCCQPYVAWKQVHPIFGDVHPSMEMFCIPVKKPLCRVVFHARTSTIPTLPGDFWAWARSREKAPGEAVRRFGFTPEGWVFLLAKRTTCFLSKYAYMYCI